MQKTNKQKKKTEKENIQVIPSLWIHFIVAFLFFPMLAIILESRNKENW